MTVRALVTGCLVLLWSTLPPQGQSRLPERQLPVFRSDAHFVRIDAFPTEKDGSVVRGLTAADFEIEEDKQPQKVDTVEFIEYERWSAGSERPEPNTQRESFALAADPRYRVFVVYVNRLSWANAHHIRQPLIDMLSKEIGPRDLYALLLPSHEASDMVFAKFAPADQAYLRQFLSVLDHMGPDQFDPVEQEIFRCFGRDAMAMIGRYRTDNLFRDLEGIIAILATLREERKSLIFVTEGMAGINERPRMGGGGMPSSAPRGRPSDLPGGQRPLPGSGGLPLGFQPPNLRGPGSCQQLGIELRDTGDNINRFRDLLRKARAANVTINPVNPAGLVASASYSMMARSAMSGFGLRQMADDTGGIAIVNNNDMRGGLKKILNDQSAYYMLGYYTTNTKWDGRPRQIKVRLLPSKKEIRARREYLPPNEADMKAMRAAADAPPRPPGATPLELANGALARLRPDADLFVRGAVRPGELAVAVELRSGLVSVSRWNRGGEVEVVAKDATGVTVRGKAAFKEGFRGALVRLPIAAGSRGPWQISASARGADIMLEEGATVAPEPATFVGQPLIFRTTPAPSAPLLPVADMEFRRTERIQIEWPVLWRGEVEAAVRIEARVLSSTGRSLGLTPTVSTPEHKTAIVLDLNLAPLATADYLIELTVDHNGQEERTLLAIRVVR